MKIVLSSNSFMPHFLGGGEIYVYRLARELQRLGNEITVLTNTQWEKGDGPFVTGEYRHEDIPVVTFSVNPEKALASEKHIGLGPLTIQALREILIKIKPDIVHLNAMKAALTLLCNEMEIPHVITAHHAGTACPSGALLRKDDSICTVSANAADCVPCCNFHRRPNWYTGGMIGKIPAWLYRPIGARLNLARNIGYIGRGLIYPWLVERVLESKKAVMDKAGLIISPSVWLKDVLVRNGCDLNRIMLVPHGIEPIRHTPAEAIECRPVRFGYIGRINYHKGLHIILQSLQLLEERRKCELHVYGKAQHLCEDKYIKSAMARYKGSPKIIMHGHLPHQRLAEAFENIDVLIVPSLVPEAFGLVVHEAFSAGRPVIVSNSGALTELVQNGINGFIVERNNSRRLSETMYHLISRPEMILEMSKQVPTVKTIMEYAGEMEELYKHIIEGHFVQNNRVAGIAAYE